MKKHSNNAGEPVKKVIVMTLSQALSLVQKLQRNGRVFRVDFVKKDGSNRTMVCRFGVRSKLKGGKASYNFSDKGLLSVWEFGKGYRTINTDDIHFIKYSGVVYVFDAPVPKGEYAVAQIDLRGRTVPAETSPMYG